MELQDCVAAQVKERTFLCRIVLGKQFVFVSSSHLDTHALTEGGCVAAKGR